MSDVRNNGSNMIIRHYEPSDLAQILALYAQQDVFADTLQLPHHPIDHWRRKIEQTEGYSCLVAVHGDEVLGQVGWQVAGVLPPLRIKGVQDTPRGGRWS